ncbi:hypothetical protein [Leptospira wolffii]|nr:hypothetical protein [Leptospira wolffii]
MHFYITEKYDRAKDKETGSMGFIYLQTEVVLRGNYKKGPIPVQIWYTFLFKADPKKGSEADPDELSEYSISERFENRSDRDAWCSNHFAFGPQEKDDITLECKHYSMNNYFITVKHKKSGKARSMKNTTGYQESLVAEVLARLLEQEENISISEPELFN